MNAPAKAPASFVSLLPPDAHSAIVGLAQNADNYIGTSPEAKAARAERDRQRAEEEARERAGITLKGKRLQQARNMTGDIVLAAASAHELVGAMCEADAQEAGRLAAALECVAQVIARKGDVLDALLHNRAWGGFGNFADEFEPLTEERAAELEAEVVTRAQ